MALHKKFHAFKMSLSVKLFCKKRMLVKTDEVLGPRVGKEQSISSLRVIV